MDRHVYVIADGSGGRGYGDAASSIAVQVILDACQPDGVPVLIQTVIGSTPARLSDRGSCLENAIRVANCEVAKLIALRKRGSVTLVCANYLPTECALIIGHVGNGRVYRIRTGRITQLTKDHTLLAACEGDPELEAKARAIGASTPTRRLGYNPEIEIDLHEERPDPGDLYVLCSAGLVQALDGRAILEIARDLDPQAAANQLVDAAFVRGATGDATAVVVAFEPDDDVAQTLAELPRGIEEAFAGQTLAPATLVDLRAAVATSARSAVRVFLSYRRADSADVTGRIADRLLARFGRDAVFQDVESIPLGVDFKQFLDEIVSQCAVLLAVIGRNWATIKDAEGQRRLDSPRDAVRIEIESALARDIPVIPLLVNGAVMPGPDQLPRSLSKLAYRNGAPIRPNPDFHTDMDRLIAALDKLLEAH